MDSRKREIRKIDRKYRRLRRTQQLRKLLVSAAVCLPILLLLCIAVTLLIRNKRLKTPPLLEDRLCVRFLDVGQGDAVLVTSEGHAALIDGGESDRGSDVAAYLRKAGVQSLDYVINTHPHSDHHGGLAAVLQAFDTAELWLPEIPPALMPASYSFERLLETAAEKHIPVRTPECGSTVPLGAAEITVYRTDNSAFDNLNDCSLCLCISLGEHSFFLAGDLGAAGEEALLQTGLLKPVTLLKAAHHGSSSSSGEAFLAVLDPQVICISVGAENGYGHPAERTLARFRKIGSPVYRTDLDGTVAFATDGTTLRVMTHEMRVD